MDDNRLIIEGFTIQELLFQLGDIRRTNDFLRCENNNLREVLKEKDKIIETLKDILKESD